MKIEQIQREHEDRLRRSRRWIIAETEDGFEVHEFTADGVAPWAVKSTKEAAAARLLQLVGIKHAILPQDYPESVFIDTVTASAGGASALTRNGSSRRAKRLRSSSLPTTR